MIGDTIRKYRKLKGFTQSALCEILNVHQTHMSKIELNIRKPSIDLLAQIRKSLDIPLQELWVNEDPESAILPGGFDAASGAEAPLCEAGPLELKLVLVMQSLNDEQKNKVLAYAMEQQELREARIQKKKLELARRNSHAKQ